MNFMNHSELVGQHAFLSASKYHWLNYDDEKLAQRYLAAAAIKRGTELHAFAANCIELGIKLPSSKKTLNMYVNDAITYKMRPEVVLLYSENCFGTADAISFRKNMLRIHDLKTGVEPASMNQLMVYAAIFCLEYRIKPGEITTELRIYQNDEALIHKPEADEILPIMDKIIKADKIIKKLREEEA